MTPYLAPRGSEVGTFQHKSHNVCGSVIDAQTQTHRESIIDNQSTVVKLKLYIEKITNCTDYAG